MSTSEDVIGGAAGVRVMLSNLERSAMHEQAIKDVRCLGAGRRNDQGMIRPVLIRDVGIEADAWIDPILGIDGGRTASAAAGAEKLAV